MTYVGGLRYRLIHDSLYNMLHDALDDRGWFDVVPDRREVTFPTEPQDLTTEIQFNTIGLADGDITDDDAELGSTLGEMRWTFYLDFFAEDRSTGVDFINEVRDILKGRMPSIGRDRAVLPVYDYTLATPTVIFYCDIEDVLVDKAQNVSNSWLKNWYTCRFDLIDSYDSDA